MAKEGRELVKEAIGDAKSLRELAVEAAKKELIESMTPDLKALVEKNIKKALRSEDTDRLRRGIQDKWPGESHTGFEESKQKGEENMGGKKGEMELDQESLAGFFPQLSEKGDEPELDPCAAAGAPGVEEESAIPTLGEGEEAEEVEEGKDVEISEAELRKVYESALQTEVQVKKGFSEMTADGEEIDPGAGIVDVKKGEHEWDKETPPAKQDYTVKEMIQRGLAENKALKAKLGEAVKMIKTLSAKIHETNLFNAKVMHVNRMLNRPTKLTTEQKKVVLESIDKATSIQQVKMVYEALTGMFSASSKPLAEGRNPAAPRANAQRARTSGQPKPEVLSESAGKASESDKYSRVRELAGLRKLVK